MRNSIWNRDQTRVRPRIKGTDDANGHSCLPSRPGGEQGRALVLLIFFARMVRQTTVVVTESQLAAGCTAPSGGRYDQRPSRKGAMRMWEPKVVEDNFNHLRLAMKPRGRLPKKEKKRKKKQPTYA